MSFPEQIKQWVAIDNQMKVLSERMKELRETKATLSEQINSYVETEELKEVKISDGQLKFIKTKETQPLTFKYLETCLKEIISNEEQVEKIIEYVKSKREVKVVADIKRISNN
jgi:hypothetical protein